MPDGDASEVPPTAGDDPARLPPRRALRLLVPWLLLVAALAAAPFAAGPSWSRIGAHVAVYALVALSVTAVTGWSGAVSLGQAGFVGLGAFVAAAATREGIPFGWCVPLAAAVAVPAALVTGFAALHLRGAYVPVATAAFNLAAVHLVFVPLEAGGSAVARPRLAGVDFADERHFLLLVLAVAVAVFGAATRVARSRTGRALLALRRSAPAAAACGVSPPYLTLAVFVLAAVVAATAGVLLASLAGVARAEDFTPLASVAYLAAAVVGGLGSIPGAVVAGAVLHLPAEAAGRVLEGSRLESQLAPLVVAAVLLAVVVARPDGAAGLLRAAAARLRHRPAAPPRELALVPPRPAPAPAPAPVAPVAPGALPAAFGRRPPGPLPAGAPETTDVVDTEVAAAADMAGAAGPAPVPPAALELRSVTVVDDTGPVLDGVSLRAEPGEVVGVVDRAGTGIAALLDACSGFVAPDDGRVVLDGADVTGLRAPARVRAGLARTFREPHLVEGMSAVENVVVGAHHLLRHGLPAEILGFSYVVRDELAARERARRLLDALGLAAVAGVAAGDLPAGPRRLVEVARALAAQPTVLLLDDPAGDLDDASRGRLGEVVSAVAGRLGVAVVVADRDGRFAAGVCDYLYVLDAGRVAAAGRPADLAAPGGAP